MMHYPEMPAREVIHALLDLLLPRACVSCEALLSSPVRGVTCGLCWSRVELLPHPQCERCGHPMKDAECTWCPLLPPFVRAARSFCWYPGGTSPAIVGALKYGGWSIIAREVAERMSRLSWPLDVMEECPTVVPVPLSSSRVRERGYNQSALLAAALAGRWGLPMMLDCLARTRSTVSQTRLAPAERASNVAGAFLVNAACAASLPGRHVLLVDDVVTTAATMNACAAALFSAGARIVSYVTFGRARSPGDLA